MTPRFQADADFNHNIILALRRTEPALDIRSAYDGGVIGEPDSSVLHIAAEAGRILLTHDRRTMPGHLARFLENRSSPGVIIVPQDLRIRTVVQHLVIIWTASDADEWRNQLSVLPL